ncbi:MAG: hypothetical protein KDK27_02555 [Leptospiraceae bacterium]|nr:hypothetical protein [Leptospiraceae bacterium]
MKHKKIIVWSVGLVLAIVGIGLYLNQTVSVTETVIDGYEPIRDDALARRYAPELLIGPEYTPPEALYYRASRDTSNHIHIAYHYVWPYERNDADGWLPWLNRMVYTGGLGIQGTMFGKGDVEVIALEIDADGELRVVQYETADNYHPSDFSVQHKTVRMQAGEFEEPLIFEVISWNHLFDYRYAGDLDPETENQFIKLKPEYFTPELWAEYSMVKAEETRISRNRAHLEFEREYVP